MKNKPKLEKLIMTAKVFCYLGFNRNVKIVRNGYDSSFLRLSQLHVFFTLKKKTKKKQRKTRLCYREVKLILLVRVNSSRAKSK